MGGGRAQLARRLAERDSMIDLALKLARLPKRRILVVGDLIEDVDLHGHFRGHGARECPGVPVFVEERRAWRWGGVGAVNAMDGGLGATLDFLHAPNESVKR